MTSSLNAIVPMACVTAAGIAAMVAEAFRDPGERMPIAGLGVVGLIGAAIASVLLWNHDASSFGVVVADNFGLFVTGILIVVGLLSLAFSGPAIERERLPGGEYYALMLFAVAGMMLMATATDLVVIFLALEVLSLAVYVLTGIRRDSPIATEAALKYFLLGAFSSAFFLYGIALTYGLAGSTRLDRIGSLMAAQALAPTPMQLLALGFLLVGFAFKVSAVPFHMWTPDAYEGAPPAVTGFMSTGVKAAAFAAFVRVFLAAFDPLRHEWWIVLWVIAAATMIVGTVVGVAQTNVKRMLAYSSIAHAGFILAGLTSANVTGIRAAMFYLIAYSVMTVGAFGVTMLVATETDEPSSYDSYDGLGTRSPALAALLSVFLLSLAGIPPTVGFIAKLGVFGAAIAAGNWPLAVLCVLASVVAAYAYLRVIVRMYFREPRGTVVDDTSPVPQVAGLVLAVAVVVLGVFPRVLSGIIEHASILRW
jgi:NADH-quinone oxidoreductase subunit N